MASAKTESGIVRVEHDTKHPYKLVNTSVADDSRLTWQARGLMFYLLSKPDNWQLRMGDLVKRSPKGVTQIRSILKELEQYGYMKRERVAGPHGTFVWNTVIYEVSQSSTDCPPSTENLHMVAPSTGFPSMEKASMENLSIKRVVNKEINNINNGGGVDKSVHPEIRDRLTDLGVRPTDITFWLRVRPNATLEDVALCEAWVEANGRPNGTLDRPCSLLWKEFLSIGSVPPPLRSVRRNGHTNGHAAATVIDRAAIAENERLARAELEAEGIAWE